jgi:hypothetical protein
MTEIGLLPISLPWRSQWYGPSERGQLLTRNFTYRLHKNGHSDCLQCNTTEHESASGSEGNCCEESSLALRIGIQLAALFLQARGNL